LCDLVWSDPDRNNKNEGWGVNETRMVSVTFSTAIVEAFLRKHDLELICRAHEVITNINNIIIIKTYQYINKQVVQDGYEFFANRQLITVFSAPNYCGDFNNAGAILKVDDNLLCSFQTIKSITKGSFVQRPSTPFIKEKEEYIIKEDIIREKTKENRDTKDNNINDNNSNIIKEV